MKQRQFLDVVTDEEAQRRIAEVFQGMVPCGEMLPLNECLGRVLFEDVSAAVDVPGFDRADMDGFALHAVDTFGAEELAPKRLKVSRHQIAAGSADLPADFSLEPGAAISIATGGTLPRGANAVLMIEDSAPVVDGDNSGDEIDVFHPVAPGANLTGAGTDVGRGEMILRAGQILGSRETALAAAVGAHELCAFAAPKVAIISTGDELRRPGEDLGPGEIYDSNGRILADAVREMGGEACELGIVPDDEKKLSACLREALRDSDLILMSGGTSKGAGDLNYRVVRALAQELPNSRGIVVHGVALKPGKPLCVAEVAGRPLVILPGFPTSAIFTFHEFVSSHLRFAAGRREHSAEYVEAYAPLRLPSAKGRTEYMLVDLVPGDQGLAAYPLGRGSGSVSTFSAADGFIRIDRHTEFVAEGERLLVRPLGDQVRRPDLVAIGSHCLGLDYLLSVLSRRGYSVKAINVGSQGGLNALARGEGDLAGTHLLDATTGEYNRSFLPENTEILGGWRRRQGLVFRRGDARFESLAADLSRLADLVREPGVVMVNRNPGSGTRVLIDRFLSAGAETKSPPEGFHALARSHHAVAAAVVQGRADWGITLQSLAQEQGLEFVFVQDEIFELAFPASRAQRPAILALRKILAESEVQAKLKNLLYGVRLNSPA
ncbi:MAG: molybdopterin biosynthesis protein [Planctomycetota bacterium]